MDLRDIQRTVRGIWTDETYAAAYRGAAEIGGPVDTMHTLAHIVKAAGKLAAAIEPIDHGGSVDADAACKALADLCICAARMCDVIPRAHLDLQLLVETRLRQIAEHQTAADHQQ